MKKYLLFCFLLVGISTYGQFLASKDDSLRGTVTKERAWWDTKLYSIQVIPDFENQTIKGCCKIKYNIVNTPTQFMQIDLQSPMNLDSVFVKGIKLNFYRHSKSVFYIEHPNQKEDLNAEIELFFSGKPKKAIYAPWDGGWVWKKDMKGRPWVSVACQGLGASVWLPCKDHQSDEPENGMELELVIPQKMMGVANGNLVLDTIKGSNRIVKWRVENPINLYNIIPSFGYYESFENIYKGKNGDLNCSYWVIDENIEQAKKHFLVTDTMLNCFENWFGPYPFYEDGYKLVETPYLGMEHQSNIAYGNNYQLGYKGRDLSLSGWGLKWDFIVIHESGHEWFGNSITSYDIADMWIHEAFTNYSEVLYVDCQFGTQAGNEYAIGLRHNIKNDKPIIGPYGVNQEGSGDMYYKGSNMIHTIRQLINDDEKFRSLLIELNKTFYHQIVTTKDIEEFMSTYSQLDLNKVFDQYLRTVDVPKLDTYIKDNKYYYRWKNCVPDFNMPIRLLSKEMLYPTTEFQYIHLAPNSQVELLKPDPNFYIQF